LGHTKNGEREANANGVPPIATNIIIDERDLSGSSMIFISRRFISLEAAVPGINKISVRTLTSIIISQRSTLSASLLATLVEENFTFNKVLVVINEEGQMKKTIMRGILDTGCEAFFVSHRTLVRAGLGEENLISVKTG
jgi:hypothetical protein